MNSHFSRLQRTTQKPGLASRQPWMQPKKLPVRSGSSIQESFTSPHSMQQVQRYPSPEKSSKSSEEIAQILAKFDQAVIVELTRSNGKLSLAQLYKLVKQHFNNSIVNIAHDCRLKSIELLRRIPGTRLVENDAGDSWIELKDFPLPVSVEEAAKVSKYISAYCDGIDLFY